MILTMTRFAEPPLAIACLITSLRKYIKNPKIIIAAMICETVLTCVPSLIRDILQNRIVLFIVIRHQFDGIRYSDATLEAYFVASLQRKYILHAKVVGAETSHQPLLS